MAMRYPSLNHRLAEFGRSQYRPPERIDWTRLSWAFPVALLSGCALAVGLWFLHFIGFGYLLITALVPALCGLRIAIWVVEESHCYHRSIAILMCLPIGLIAYFGFWQAEMVEAWGWQVAWRIDELPSFIWKSWETQQYFSRAGRLFDHPFPANVVIFALECLFIVGMPVAAAGSASSRVFSDENQCWAKAAYVCVSPDLVPLFEDEFRSGSLECLLQVLERIPIPDPQKPPPRLILKLEYVGGRTVEAYLSATSARKFYARDIFHRSWLTLEEFQASRRLFRV